jgi:uncharacterized membrane protein
MSSASVPVLFVSSLLVFPLFCSPALPQTIPVRLLDSTSTFTDDFVVRVREGVAVGTGDLSGNSKGALWDGAGSHSLLPLAGNTVASASDFNDAGDVVGTSVKSFFFARAATVWRNGTAIDVNSLVTGGIQKFLGTATTIDAAGRIAGEAGASSRGPFTVGYLLDQGTVLDLGKLTNGNVGVTPLRMNDDQQITGIGDAGGVSHAFLWDHGLLTDLHDPAQITGTTSEGVAINRFGVICGDATFSTGHGSERQSAVTFDHGVVTDLGANVPSPSQALGVNDFGAVVGTYLDPTLGSLACRFENGGATDLNTLIAAGTGWTLEIATDVDDEGRIVGVGHLNGVERAFILEPSFKGTFTVYGTGCTGPFTNEPVMTGVGVPSPDQDFALFTHEGDPNAVGLLLVGSSNGVVTFKPGCDVEVLPLLLPPAVIALDGLGQEWLAAHVPSGVGPLDLFVQSFFFVPPSKLPAATKPVQIHIE